MTVFYYAKFKKEGEPLARQEKEETVRESMNSPKIIDTTISFKIPRSAEQFDPTKHKYKCSCCGKGFSSQKLNFQKSNSPLFQSNDGFLPWCKECTDKYMILLTAFYSNNEEHAIKHFCQQVDWVYDIEPLKCAREISSDRSRISSYAAKKNLNVGGRKTYIDTLKHDYEQKKDEIITSREQAKSETSTITASAIDRWGIGFSEADYKLLDDHYKMLKKYNPNCDNNQEIFIKDLCYTKLLQMKAMRGEGKSDDFDKYTRLYRDTFKQAGLKTIQETDNSADESLGVTLATISQYTPEEYYKDKQLYKDYDGLGEYFERFVKRPLKNLMLGTNERDRKYRVKEKSGDLDE